MVKRKTTTGQTAAPTLPAVTTEPRGIESGTKTLSGATAPPPSPAFTREKTRTQELKGKIAIVIDDAGNSTLNLMPFLKSAAKLTIAVLPELPQSAESARIIAASGKEVILHLPMEAINGNNTGPGAIFTYNTEAEITEILAADFADVSQARGVNNHMGSKATTDSRVMETVMQYLKETGKFFLDSKTAPTYLPEQSALKFGVPYLTRDVFLDNETDKEYILKQFREGIKICLVTGKAVLIGHVQHPMVAEVINELLPEVENEGIALVYISELL